MGSVEVKAGAASVAPQTADVCVVGGGGHVGLPLSLALEEASMKSADAAEAQQAFREKREPSYSGR